MFDLLKLKKEVSETTADIEADDVISVKTKLKDLGHYQEPEWGISYITDDGMFSGIRNFQKEKGLAVDGVMKPEGETEGKINEVLKQKNTPSNNSLLNIDQDKAIKDRIYPVIKKHEDYTDYPYKDTKNNITIGFGTNINDKKKFDSLKLQDERGYPINRADADRHYYSLLNMQGGNMVADNYKDKTPLRISEQESRRLYDEHINDDLRYLRRTFKDFDKFPPQMQDVLTDIKYNTGNVENSPNGWPKLHRAIVEKNLEDIIANVNRKDVPQTRNDWAKGELRKIRRLDY